MGTITTKDVSANLARTTLLVLSLGILPIERSVHAQAAIPVVESSRDNSRPLPAGDAPAFLLVSVQPIKAPASWRRIYHEVEQCAGRRGDYDAIRWGVMEAPLQGPKGPTYGFTVGHRIVLLRGDTTYLRHEMLHHILEFSGWQPRALKPGEHYTIADLHPMPLFGVCTAGR
jgi:hypothetical protein